MKNTLINYIRKSDKTPYGVVIATKVGDEVRYGYSIQNPVDKWDRSKGLKIAIARAEAGEYQLPRETSKLFDAVVFSLRSLEKRSMKYFKNVSEEKKIIGY